jgi:hypothetical protein
MPAIQLARLKIQVTDLLAYFDDPVGYMVEFHALLNFYADRTRRPGRSGRPKPLIQAYNVPRQIMRRIENDLRPFVATNPPGALELADHLWADPWYESRSLAISILGLISPEKPDFIVERLQTWGKSCREDALLDALLDIGAAGLRTENPDQFLSLVEFWLSDDDKTSRKNGMRALPALILMPNFENLPTIYRILSPLIREASSVLEVDLTRTVRALAKRSPQETAYFLKQNLIAPHKAGLTTILRRSLDVFPPDLEEMLRAELRERIRIEQDLA